MTEMPPNTRQSAERASGPENAPRKVSLLLGIGILFVPLIFAWLLLRKGYSEKARIIGFGWMGVLLIATSLSKAPSTATKSEASQVASSTPAVAPIAPTPEEIAERKAAEEAKVKAEAEADADRTIRRNPETALALEKLIASKGGFETIFILSGTIVNTSRYPMKDIDIRCDLAGPSGTTVGSVRETLYENVPENGSHRFRGLSMGFMGSSQVSKYTCEVKKAVIVTP